MDDKPHGEARGSCLFGTNPSLHARPSALISKMAAFFESDIDVCVNNYCVNGKELMALMTLELYYQTRVDIRCTGPDADRALKAMIRVFEANLNEDGWETFSALKPS